jgi:hypothetical protein
LRSPSQLLLELLSSGGMLKNSWQLTIERKQVAPPGQLPNHQKHLANL